MKIHIFSAITYSLISIIIFLLVFSNSYALFVDKQEDMFIEDVLIRKVLNGDKFNNVESVVKYLENENVSYVVYYKEDDTFYLKKHDYDNMNNLEMDGTEIRKQQIGDYKYAPLDIETDNLEILISIKGFDEEEVMMFFDYDGVFGVKNWGYEGMISSNLFLALLFVIALINYLFLYLHLYARKEKVGVMKILGYSSEYITKLLVRQISIYFIFSIILVYLLNFEYINYMFNQIYIFKEGINLLLLYIGSILLTVFLSGAITYCLVERKSTIDYIREVTYD